MSITMDTLHHVGIIVSDMGRSLAFYNKLLGKEPKSDVTANGPELWAQTQVDDATMRIVFIDFGNGGVGLELIEFKDKKGEHLQPKQNDAGALHICFKVSNAEETYNQMIEEGYEFIAPPQYLDEKYSAMKGHTFGYFRDPDGVLLEIMQDPSFFDKITG